MQDVMDIKVTPLSPACGCQIEGVDLSQDQPEAVIEAIKAAWRKHLVIVIRGQNITHEQQLRFAAHFGFTVAHQAQPDFGRVELKISF